MGVKITRLDEQTISVGPLDLFCTELLHQIHLCADPEARDNEAARARLFPSPTRGADQEFDQDWRDYVEPGLAELFASNLDIIQKDLANFPPARPAADHHTLHLPIKHLEAWIHGLNQARLALAARYDFSEKEMEAEIPPNGDMRSLALFQVHFYGWLEECFLRVLGDD
jgi:hypothetical protein